MFPLRGEIAIMKEKRSRRPLFAPLFAAALLAVFTRSATSQETKAQVASSAKAPEQPFGCASVRVLSDQTIVRRAPDGTSRRRGVAMRGARLEVLGIEAGPGCADSWYRVYEDGWICGRSLEKSDLPPDAPRYPVVPEGALTPWPYAFVREPTIEYDYVGGQLTEVRALLEGFGFGVAGSVTAEGRAFLKTAEGNLVPRGTAGITSRLSEFEGMAIADGGPWPVGWINAKKAWAYDAPSKDKKHRVASAERYQAFEALEVIGRVE